MTRSRHLALLLMVGAVAGFSVLAALPSAAQQQRHSLKLQLRRTTLENVDDEAGRWQFAGGKVLEGQEHVANYASTKRVLFRATGQQNTAMLTMTIFFLGEKPPENITLQGTHDFKNGGQIGSVSAASPKFSLYIGKTFVRRGDTVTIGK